MNTIKDMLQFIFHQADVAYALNLLKPRTRGSTTTLSLLDLDLEAPVIDITSELPDAVKIPGCRYHEFKIPGVLGALPLSKITDAVLQLGPHGPELVAKWTGVKRTDDLRTTRATFISHGVEAWTWHPGRPLASFQDRWTGAEFTSDPNCPKIDELIFRTQAFQALAWQYAKENDVAVKLT